MITTGRAHNIRRTGPCHSASKVSPEIGHPVPSSHPDKVYRTDDKCGLAEYFQPPSPYCTAAQQLEERPMQWEHPRGCSNSRIAKDSSMLPDIANRSDHNLPNMRH